MSPLRYEVNLPPDVRWSRLKILCKHHPEQMIAEWSTFDGKQVIMWLEEGSREEYIGWQPDEETKGYLHDTPAVSFLAVAVDAPKPGDVAHQRISMVCGRPSCPYGPQIRDDQVKRLSDLVCSLWASGDEEMVIPDLDSLWRREDV